MTLRTKLVAFEKATDDFHGCPERFDSGPISAGAQKIIDRFFELRKELSKIGLELETNRQWPTKFTPLEAAVYRWGVWQQAASHTASLLLADPSRNLPASKRRRMEWPDSAAIMKYLETAEDAMFEALDKEGC